MGAILGSFAKLLRSDNDIKKEFRKASWVMLITYYFTYPFIGVFFLLSYVGVIVLLFPDPIFVKLLPFILPLAVALPFLISIIFVAVTFSFVAMPTYNKISDRIGISYSDRKGMALDKFEVLFKKWLTNNKKPIYS